MVVEEKQKLVSKPSSQRKPPFEQRVAQFWQCSFQWPEWCQQTPRSEGFYSAQQAFARKPASCPTYQLGFVEQEKLGSGGHWACYRVLFSRPRAGLEWLWQLKTEWQPDEPHEGKVLKEFTSLETAISDLHVLYIAPPILWSGMNLRKVLCDHLASF